MKRLISLQIYVATLFLIILLGSLNCSSIPLVPSLPQRTLRISTVVPGFEYHYEVCIKTIIVCVKKEWRTDYYDLTDLKVRNQLIDMNFVAKVRETK